MSNTSLNKDAGNTARIKGVNMPISFKHSYEISNFLTGMNLSKAKAYLDDVLVLKRAIPFTKFKGDVGHRPGKMGPGKYPFKASKTILQMLKDVEANAQFKGLNTGSLVIKSMIANKGENAFHPGRKRRRKFKRTHLEIVVESISVKSKVAEKAPKPEKNVKQEDKK